MPAGAAGKTGRKVIIRIRFFCCEVSKYRKRIAEYVGFCSPFCLPDTVQKNAERLYLNYKLLQGGAEEMGQIKENIYTDGRTIV